MATFLKHKGTGEIKSVELWQELINKLSVRDWFAKHDWTGEGDQFVGVKQNNLYWINTFELNTRYDLNEIK